MNRRVARSPTHLPKAPPSPPSPPSPLSPFRQGGSHRIPNRIYVDAELHARELEAFFYKAHWCYVALECEIPKPGDYKATMIGEKPVIVVRDRDGSVNVLENR